MGNRCGEQTQSESIKDIDWGRKMVLIKNLDKPKSCAECRLRDMHYTECNVTHKKIYGYIYGQMLPKWCPLTEVEPYGPEDTLYKEK